jgi:dTMP kinase
MLIVIDGTDASGKSTQVSLISNKLRADGREVRTVDFPEYYKNFFGKFIGECLSDIKYNWLNVHPKIASALYAADRWESRKKINRWLKKGYIVIANRYASANQIHQGGKIKNIKERQEFLRWLDDMEFKVYGIPRPNAIFYLHVPLPFVKKMLRERNKNSSREYLGKKKDVHEKDPTFMKNSSESALWLAETQPNWVKIDCIKDNQMRTPEDIHKEIYDKIKSLINKKKE